MIIDSIQLTFSHQIFPGSIIPGMREFMRCFFINCPHWIGALVLALCIGAQAGETLTGVKPKPASRIVFLGDSAAGQHGYTTLVADYFALCQGDMHLSFRTSSSSAIWR